jgi:hypothetical protein
MALGGVARPLAGAPVWPAGLAAGAPGSALFPTSVGGASGSDALFLGPGMAAAPFLHPFMLPPRRFKHCASHVYIAHFIDQQQQQQRFALFQQHQAALFASHQAAAVAAAAKAGPPTATVVGMPPPLASLPLLPTSPPPLRDAVLPGVKAPSPLGAPPAGMLSAQQMAYAQQLAYMHSHGGAFPSFTAQGHFPSAIMPGFGPAAHFGGGVPGASARLPPVALQQLQLLQQQAAMAALGRGHLPAALPTTAVGGDAAAAVAAAAPVAAQLPHEAPDLYPPANAVEAVPAS